MLREMKIDFCPLRHIRITEGGLRAERLINNTETEGYSLNQLACADATDTTGSPQSLLWGLCLASWATDLDRLDSNLSSLPRLPLSAVRAGRIPRRALRRGRPHDAVVLVWKLDRSGRSLRHLVNALAEFESLGIAFVSLSDNQDLSTASGRLMFQIIGAMAEFERELIRERVKAGMKNARAKGARIGRPRVAVDTTMIAALRASGLSWRTIERKLGISVRTARRFAFGRGKKASPSASATPIISEGG